MNLFAFGSNASGQLGLGHEEDVSTPHQCLSMQQSTDAIESEIPSKHNIVQIVAGGNHTLLLTHQGHVYASGCNTDWRCGPDPDNLDSFIEEQPRNGGENLLRFRRVIITDRMTGSRIDTFKHVSATWEGSILVANAAINAGDEKPTHQDKVFVLGSSPKGELGLRCDTGTTMIIPGTSIPDFPPSGTQISALASSMGHTVAVLSNGEVYGWGGARKGQLGDELKGEKISWTPRRINGIPFATTGAVCGREFTVLLGKKTEMEFMVLGDRANRWGILDVVDSEGLRLRIRERKTDGAGTGTEGTREEEMEKASVDSFAGAADKWRLGQIGASWHGIYAHVNIGESLSDAHIGSMEKSDSMLIAWGRNDRGQLPPPDLPALDELAVGSEHVLALLRDGSVAAFGWGEHGNCGPETDPHGNVAGLYKSVPLADALADRKRVVGVGAGCATSWLIVD
ncbi:uncharacterized protein N7483_006884 [Penicillium malachiteum]|uniref:uncharacterized protein n=1 Tax=Penicillium malachiteum TaxID=1324776 RepID=UPI002546D09C|nr:uncharacterized protein N7483_006884 [Penicillium malachiteum]KAJ5725527.1 hypothetical protein N7483_006884 [Penicillium malachiteum]